MSEQFAKRPGSIRRGDRLIGENYGNASGNYEPLGLAEQIRGKRKALTTGALSEPQRTVAQTLHFAGKLPSLRTVQPIEKSENSDRAQIHGIPLKSIVSSSGLVSIRTSP